MTYQELILSHGPSNYWRLNESSGLTAADSAGSAPGTISGGVTLGQASGLSDGTTAMTFNGTTGKIDTGASVSLPLTVTIECWMKTTDGSSQRGAVSNYSVGAGNAVFCGIGTGGTLFCYSTGGVSGGGTGGVADGLWHHVCYVLNGSTVILYRDAVVDGSGAQVRTVPSSGVLSIGADAGLGQYWNGLLDEVAIYPRALTPTEISDHYAARLTTAVPSAGCDHTTVWSKHLATLSAPTVESERAYLATLYAEPGGTDVSTLVSRWLQAITCGATSLEATVTPETVQTGTASAAAADTLTLTFPGATGNGRGLVVGVISSSSSALPAGACSDNKGNTYTRILSQTGTANSLAVYLCPKGVGGPVHSITIAPALGAISLMAAALEVRGVGAGLALDASGSTSGSSATPAATSSAVTTPGLVAMALMALNTQQTTLAVSTTDGTSPGWTQEAEALA